MSARTASPPALHELVTQAAVQRASMRVAGSICELVGRTPLVRLRRIERDAPGCEIHVKCELMNPGGSVKDRPALRMLQDAIADGRLEPGRTIVDATSGNTGVAYSLYGAALGYRVALVMPENVSEARKRIARAYGSELLFSSPMEGSDGAIRKVRALVAAEPERYFYPDQYSNPSNPRAHEDGTGGEIVEQIGARITHFVAGMGTSGTIMGTGRRLKAHRRHIQIVAVEPDDALHGLEGLKHMASSIVPDIYHPEEIDRVLPMSTDDAWDMADRIVREEGIFCGHSGGAAVAGALRVAREAGPGAVVVTLLPDRGDRYFAPMKWEKQYVW